MILLIIVDNKYRDLATVLLLKKYIEEFTINVKIILANKINHKRIYDYYLPDMVILPNYQLGKAEWIKHYKDKNNNVQIVILPTEGGSSYDKTILLRHSGNNDNFDKDITKIFLWGNKDLEVLNKHSKYRPDQLLVTGCPRFDIYKQLGDKVQRADPAEIGIVTSLRFLSNYKLLSINQLIDGYSLLNQSNTEHRAWNQGGQFADCLWWETSFLESIHSILKEDKKSNYNYKFQLRPHPLEDDLFYSDLEDKYNLNATKHIKLWDYLEKVSLIIQCFSTCSVEALMMNKPVISLINMLGTKSNNIVHEDYTTNYLESILWQPKSLDELFELIELNNNNEIDAVPDNKPKIEFLDNYYSYNTSSSTSVIGNDIINMLGAKDIIKRTYFNPKRFVIKTMAEIYFLFRIYTKTDAHLSKYRFKDLSLINKLDNYLKNSELIKPKI
jgi:surface carbohydrate biosynthesis protein